MDNRMVQMILEDWMIENAGPQTVSAVTGRVLDNWSTEWVDTTHFRESVPSRER